MIEPLARAANPIDPGATIGHVHLRTADIDRVRRFYVDVLGFDVISEARDVPGWGTTGDVLFIKMIGFGMIVALIVDATIVRALLVPATMRLLPAHTKSQGGGSSFSRRPDRPPRAPCG